MNKREAQYRQLRVATLTGFGAGPEVLSNVIAWFGRAQDINASGGRGAPAGILASQKMRLYS